MVTLAQFKSKLLSLLREDFYTKTEIDTKENTINSILANKVDTERNKGLSTEDYTTEEKIKLSKLKEIEMIDDISEIEGDGTFFLIDEESNVYTISLDASKDIISSGETVDITATLLMNNLPLSNKEILFDDGTSQIDITTDSNGEAVYTYTGTGAGDVNIIASWNMLLQEIYELQDLVYYNTNTYTTKVDIDVDLPSNYEVSFKFTRKSSSSASGVLVGTNGSRNAYIGQYSSAGQYGVSFLNPTNQVQLGTSATNTEITFTLKYNNGTYTMSNGTNTVTLTDFVITKITNIDAKNNCPISDIKIKAL